MTDDKLRAAPRTQAGRRLLDREVLNGRSFTLIRAEDIRAIEDEAAALAASAPDEGPLPAGHPDTWPGGTMHMPASAPDEEQPE